MRLLKLDTRDEFSLTKEFHDETPPYAILSHTWGSDDDEVTFEDLQTGLGKSKAAGYAKIQFCAKQARKDDLEHFWVDSCCINKANHAELSEAINSMFYWYRDAAKCYVYLSDVSARKRDNRGQTQWTWEPAFRKSRWFTRGWTLQEILAPKSVKFFSREGDLLGNKNTLERQIHEITGIPVEALRGTPLSHFSVDERKRWAEKRQTRRKEEKAYCLLGIFTVFIPLIYGEGDHAFVRLEDEISKRSGEKDTAVIRPGTRLTSPSSSAPPGHVHWMVTRPTNALFTGREDLLKELDSIIRDVVESPRDRIQCRIVISGMGGQGKSEICVQLAHRLRQKFWGIFWIDVSATHLAEASFLEVAEKLSQTVQTWEGARLAISNLKYPWLLVLDNADDPDVDYQQYFPSGSLGVVILTSRNDECQQHATAKSIVLQGLSDDDAQELLLKAAHVPQDQYTGLEKEAKRVAGLLQSHPLALIQAGAYISRGHCTLAAYPHVLERQRQRLLSFRPAQARSRYRDVYATFEASTTTLKTSEAEAAQDALRLLPLLAVCGLSRLPMSLFEAGWNGAKGVSPEMDDEADDDEVILLTPWHVARLPSLVGIAGDGWDAFRLVEAVCLLRAFSLVMTDSHDGHLSVSMHPLVHAWARDRQSEDEQHESWLQMGCLIALASYDEAFWEKNKRQVQPHIETMTGCRVDQMFAAESPVLVTRILVNCGWVLQGIRSDAKLFNLLEKIFSRLKLDPLSLAPRWIGVYTLAGRNLLSCGKVKKAVLLLKQVVRIREQSLATDHPDRLASQHELARAYQANGQVKEAVALLEEVVKIQEQSLATDHPDRLVSQQVLAGAYQANGRVKEALALLEEVVKIKEQSLATDHPSRLASQHELARAYEANGQVKEAVALLEEVVKIREQSLATDHPDRLASQQVLAGAYQANGRVKEALALLEEVVKIKEQSLATDHPSRLASQHELARAYHANGQVKEAVALLEEVVKIQEQSLATDHPSRLASQHELARAYRANGQAKEAVALLEEVVRIQEQSLAKDHPSRLGSQHNLATYLWQLGSHKAARDMMARVVHIRRQVLDENHPARESSEEWLNFFEIKKGKR